MAQKSIPWGYLTGLDSAIGYTAKEDSAIRACMARSGVMVVDGGIRTIAAFANLGPFYSVANRLAVTNPGGAANRIDVDTGASFCCGIYHYNSASIGAAGDITSPVANPRIDRVVVRANFGAASYVPASASAALFTVPTNTARVTIIHGVENAAPVAPALTQDTNRATYWDIPLYQYQISVAGAITNLTDEREWVDAETKRIFVPALMGYNATDALDVSISWTGDHPVIAMIDNKVVRAWGKLLYPSDCIGDITSKGIIYVSGGGGNNIYADNELYAGACGEAAGTHSNASGFAAETIAIATQYSCHRIITLSTATNGDIMVTRFVRDGVSALDTVGATVYFCGWFVYYLGWR